MRALRGWGAGDEGGAEPHLSHASVRCRYEAPDQAQLEITATEQENEKQREEHEEQIAEYNRMIENEKKRKDMMMRDQDKEVGQRGEHVRPARPRCAWSRAR